MKKSNKRIMSSIIVFVVGVATLVAIYAVGWSCIKMMRGDHPIKFSDEIKNHP